jgi:hypothetical protein
MALEFYTLDIDTPAGPRTAMVITPVAPLVVQARPYIPGTAKMSDADLQVLEGARKAADSSATVCIFRAVAPIGDGSYRFAPGMSEHQAISTALSMLDGQMRVYREMLRLGLCLFLHTDLGPLEVHGFRGAVDQRVEELEPLTRGGGEDAKRAQLDLWLLRNLNFFFTLGFDKLIATILPDKLALMEKRMERIRRLAHEVADAELA